LERERERKRAAAARKGCSTVHSTVDATVSVMNSNAGGSGKSLLSSSIYRDSTWHSSHPIDGIL